MMIVEIVIMVVFLVVSIIMFIIFFMYCNGKYLGKDNGKEERILMDKVVMI